MTIATITPAEQRLLAQVAALRSQNALLRQLCIGLRNIGEAAAYRDGSAIWTHIVKMADEQLAIIDAHGLEFGS